MDITTFVTSNRDKALGDWATYRSQLSHQILSLRKRLGRTTPKNSKYAPKAPITAEDIGSDPLFARLQILSAERAWAHAMHIKVQHTQANKPITGSGRSHIVSRLAKAVSAARTLVEELKKQDVSKATKTDVLEAEGYAYTLAGTEEFEKQANGGSRQGKDAKERWKKCLAQFSAAQIIYTALQSSTQKEVHKEVLASTVDPSLRYASHQANVSRSLPLSAIARDNFPKSDAELQGLLKEIDASALQSQPAADTPKATGRIPSTIQWGSRKANISDASIGQALASVGTAEAQLTSYLMSAQDASPRDRAAAYDDVIIASQDAADATRRAIEDLEREHVDEGDGRMQDLRVTNLAVNYDVVAWRVGRNRMLIGEKDGAEFNVDQHVSKKRKRAAKDSQKDESAGRRLARLRERVHLYEEILQSVDSVKELRGAVRNAAFIEELDCKRAYFQALK